MFNGFGLSCFQQIMGDDGCAARSAEAALDDHGAVECVCRDELGGGVDLLRCGCGEVEHGDVAVVGEAADGGWGGVLGGEVEIGGGVGFDEFPGLVFGEFASDPEVLCDGCAGRCGTVVKEPCEVEGDEVWRENNTDI